ncbi:MAG: hypothetical protein RJB63_333 [Actinomycetota bacterium]|jgi:hypothetical protein
MKKAFWLLTGIAAGVLAAKKLQENPKTKAIVDDVMVRVRELGDVVAEGFREREAELAAEKKSAEKPAAKSAGASTTPNA